MCQARVSQRCAGESAHTHHRNRDRKDNRPVNLMRVCAFCHDWIHNNVELAYQLGFLVHSWDDPAEIPVDAAPVAPASNSPQGAQHRPGELEPCPRCKGKGKIEPPKKREKTRLRAVRSTRVPKDEQENGAEVLDVLWDECRTLAAPDMGWKEDVPEYYVQTFVAAFFLREYRPGDA